MTAYHLAQLNIAHLRAPLDDPSMTGFVNGLDRINALAERSPGFVWRLLDDATDNATTVRPIGPDHIINLTVWESAEALRAFTYQTEHLDFLRRRREWFHGNQRPAPFVNWWIPAGTLPALDEAIDRLHRLAAHGPSPEAFTFRHAYPAPVTPAAAPPAPLPARPA